MWFKQDGAPPHLGKETFQLLKEKSNGWGLPEIIHN